MLVLHGGLFSKTETCLDDLRSIGAPALDCHRGHPPQGGRQAGRQALRVSSKSTQRVTRRARWQTGTESRPTRVP